MREIAARASSIACLSTSVLAPMHSDSAVEIADDAFPSSFDQALGSTGGRSATFAALWRALLARSAAATHPNAADGASSVADRTRGATREALCWRIHQTAAAIAPRKMILRIQTPISVPPCGGDVTPRPAGVIVTGAFLFLQRP